eukprot:s761_g3.t1
MTTSLESSFEKLAQTRADQPVNPVNVEALMWPSEVGKESPEKAEGISAMFRSIVDQLIEQHVTELSEAQSWAELLQSENATLRTRVESQDSTEDSVNATASCGGAEWRPKRHSVCRRRGPEVHASQILSALESGDAAELMRSATNTSKLSLQQSFQLLHSQSLELPTQVGLRGWLQSNTFELLIAVALFLNVLWIAIEVQIFGSLVGADLGVEPAMVSPDAQPQLRNIFNLGNMIFTVFFALDVVVRVAVLRLDLWKAWMNYLDLIVGAASVAEVALYYTELSVRNLAILRVLRVGKLVR